MEFNRPIIWVWTVEGEVLRIISQKDVMERELLTGSTN